MRGNSRSQFFLFLQIICVCINMYVGVLENNPEDVKLRVSILFSFANYLPLKVSKHFNLICTYKLKKTAFKENNNTSSHVIFPQSLAWLRFGQATKVPNDPKPWIGPSSGWATPRQAVEQPRYSKTFFLTKPKLIILSDQFDCYDIDCFICMNDNEREASNESFSFPFSTL